MKFWLLLGLEILAVVMLFNSCFPKEYKTKHPEFIYGGINEEGHYDFSVQNSICTEDAIKCTKFRITRDFSADYDVKFYFYNSNDVLVAIGEMKRTELDVNYINMPEGATAIRIVLSRNTPFSDWDRFKFRWFDLDLSVSTREGGGIFSGLKDKFKDLLNPESFDFLISGSNKDNDSVTEETWSNGHNISFRRGEIDTLGFLDKNAKSAVYTENLISCDGYRLTFYSGTDYLCFVHYYTADGRWLSVQSVNAGETFVVKDSDMPCITADDGTQLSAAGIRICLVKIKTDFTGLNPSANEVSLLDALNANKCLSLDICYLPIEAAA